MGRGGGVNGEGRGGEGRRGKWGGEGRGGEEGYMGRGGGRGGRMAVSELQCKIKGLLTLDSFSLTKNRTKLASRKL